jgi:hypothetical protein
VVVLVTFGQVFETRPFEGDNLYVLQWADSAGPEDLLALDPAIYPEWRPMAFATVWLEYQYAAHDHLWVYYSVNVLLWTACGALIFWLVRALTTSSRCAFLAAALVLTSHKLISSFVLIVDRQSSLACFFGLSAWLAIVGLEKRRPTRFEWAGVTLLLVASALSKEYGLAFAGAIGVYETLAGRRDLAWSGAAAIAAYAALRIGFAGGALAVYCESQGYFFGMRTVCFDGISASTVSQAVYNVFATGLGTLLSGLFGNHGIISVSPKRLTMSFMLLPIAVLGWVKGPKPCRVGLLVVVLNTLQSFLLYRARNHVVGVCALGVAIGTGMPIAANALRAATRSRYATQLAYAAFLGLLLLRGDSTRTMVAARVEESSTPDECLPGVPQPDRRFIRRVWHQYGLTLPPCGRLE